MKFYLFVLIALLGISGCGTGPETAGTNDVTPVESTSPEGGTKEGETAAVYASPKDALEAFVKAVEAKDEAAFKAALSEKSVKMMDLSTKVEGKPLSDLFKSKDFEKMGKMPEIRNEKIDGDKATLEAKDPDGDEWAEMAFVKENGSWKLAMLDSEYDKDYEALSKQAEEVIKKKEKEKEKEKESDKPAEKSNTSSVPKSDN